MKLLFEKGTMTYTTEIKTKDGRIIPFEVTSRIYKNKNRYPIGVCIARDITDRVELEKKSKSIKRATEFAPRIMSPAILANIVLADIKQSAKP